jgi:hypothetical protein
MFGSSPLAVSAQDAANVPECIGAPLLPRTFQLDFVVHAAKGPFGLSGEYQVRLERVGDEYTLTGETSSLFYRARQRSSGAWVDGAPTPLDYSEESSTRSALTTHLDWRAGTVTFSASNQAATIAPGMQDRLSLLLQLSLRGRATTAADAAIDVPVAGVRGTSVYHFAARGSETLDLPIGRQAAVRLEQVDSKHDRLEVWLAPSLCWLPVRIRYRDGRGSTIDNQLRALQLQ